MNGVKKPQPFPLGGLVGAFSLFFSSRGTTICKLGILKLIFRNNFPSVKTAMSTTTQIQNINQLVETFLTMHGVNVAVFDEWKTSKIQTSLEEVLRDASTKMFDMEREIKALKHQFDEEANKHPHAIDQARKLGLEQEAQATALKQTNLELQGEMNDTMREAQLREEALTTQLKGALSQVHDLEQHVVEWEVWKRDTEGAVKVTADAYREWELKHDAVVADYQKKLDGWIERALKSEDKIEELKLKNSAIGKENDVWLKRAQDADKSIERTMAKYLDLQQELKDCQEQLSNVVWERDDFVEREWNVLNTPIVNTWG